MPVVYSRMDPCPVQSPDVEITRAPPAMYVAKLPGIPDLVAQANPATFLAAWFAFLTPFLSIVSLWILNSILLTMGK